MSTDFGQIAKEFWDRQPHPHQPALTIGEYATMVKLATLARFGGHASGHEAALFAVEFKASGLSPQDFERTLERLAPLSFTYHGRPPSMQEIVQLKDKTPKEATTYFGDLPHKIYPHVSAANMVKALQSARPHAMEHLGREPVLPEAVYLHHSGADAATYYQKLGAASQTQGVRLAANVLPAEFGGNPGDRGLETLGR